MYIYKNHKNQHVLKIKSNLKCYSKNIIKLAASFSFKNRYFSDLHQE